MAEMIKLLKRSVLPTDWLTCSILYCFLLISTFSLSEMKICNDYPSANDFIMHPVFINFSAAAPAARLNKASHFHLDLYSQHFIRHLQQQRDFLSLPAQYSSSHELQKDLFPAWKELIRPRVPSAYDLRIADPRETDRVAVIIEPRDDPDLGCRTIW